MAFILVTGATGYIGGRLVPKLLEKGHRLRCLARHLEALQGRSWPGVEMVEGDVLKPETLEKALHGIDIAYYLVHSMRAGEAGFTERDRQAAQNFAAAAKRTGVRQIIYLGGLGSSQEGLSTHLESRQEVGQILRESGVPVTEFRAAIIVGSGSISFEMIRYLTERVPVMVCPRWVTSRCQPIAIRDVLSYLVAATESPEALCKVFEIGGKDVLSYRDMMLGYAQIRGLRRLIIPIPVLTPRFSSYWVDFVTPIPAAISRPLIEGLRNDVVCHDQSSRQMFPGVHPISYLDAVQLALNRVKSGEIETIWSGSYAALGTRRAPPYRLESREGMLMEVVEAEVAASPARVFQVVSGIGGSRGWFSANWLWKLRGWLDRLAGGIGMRRGRRDPNHLQSGDVVDFWRVEAVQLNRVIRLRAEMKIPGKAWLQFEIEGVPNNPEKSRLVQTAFFEPRGLAGLLYWYLMYPAHRVLFPGLTREIARRGEAQAGVP